jgi:hypothetical protein
MVGVLKRTDRKIDSRKMRIFISPCGPLVSPPRVLACEPQHQLANVAADLWVPWTPRWMCPVSGEEAAVPCQQCSRGHEESAPTGSGEQPARRGQESPVRRSQRGARHLPAQNGQLVAEHNNLELLEVLRAKAKQHERHHSPKHHVQERHRHQAPPIADRASDPTRPTSQNARAKVHERVLAPHRLLRCHGPGGAPLTRRRAAIQIGRRHT